MKKLYLILGILILVIVGVAVYLFALNKPQAPASQPSNPGTLPSVASTTDNGTQSGGEGGSGAASAGSNAAITLISDDPAISYFANADHEIFLVKPDGEIESIENTGTMVLSSSTAENIIDASFSRDGKMALVNFGYVPDPQTSIFNISSSTWRALGLGVISPVWSPVDDRLAYLKYNSDGSFTLSTLDLSKPSAKPISLITLNAQDMTLSWPTENQIILTDKPSAYEENMPLIYDLSKKAISTPIPEAYGLEAIWGADLSTPKSAGVIALTFASGDAMQGGNLTLWSTGLSSNRTLNFYTLPSKCVFDYADGAPVSENTASSTAGNQTSTADASPELDLYCAIPGNSSNFQNSVLPDAYNEELFFTSDSFYKIDAATGGMQNLFTPKQAIDATNLKIFGNTLYFINRLDSKLYSLSFGS